MAEIIPLNFTYHQASQRIGLGQTKIRELVASGVIRAVNVGDRVLLNAEDVDRVGREGYDPRPHRPPVQRGDDHWTRRRRRPGADDLPPAA